MVIASTPSLIYEIYLPRCTSFVCYYILNLFTVTGFQIITYEKELGNYKWNNFEITLNLSGGKIKGVVIKPNDSKFKCTNKNLSTVLTAFWIDLSFNCSKILNVQ